MVLCLVSCSFNCVSYILCARRVDPDGAYGRVLAGRLSSVERNDLISRLVSRAKNSRPDDIPRGTSFSESSYTPSSK